MARNKVKANPRSASDVDAIIGARVRAKRLERGMSQDVLASAIGVTFQQIQKYERGVNRIAASTLLDIASALETPVHTLLPHAIEPIDGSTARMRWARDIRGDIGEGCAHDPWRWPLGVKRTIVRSRMRRAMRARRA